MTFDSTTTIRDIVTTLPVSTRLFEKLKIDYCCGGDKPLGEACKSAGIAIDKLTAMLNDISKANMAEAAPDFQNSNATELINYILEKHHVYTKDEMARLELLADKVVSVHGKNHSELLELQDVMNRLFSDLKQHLFKEEQILFPYIVALEKSRMDNETAPFAPFGTVANPIRMMLTEHDAAGELLREMRKITSDYQAPSDACISYTTLYKAIEAFEADLHQHIHLENNLLFLKATALENELRGVFAP